MISKRRILLFSFLIGLGLWFIDAVLDHAFFYKGYGSFADILFLRVPPHELYIRTIIVIVLLASGALLAQVIHRSRREILAQKAWFATTLKSIGDAVITTDTQGRITFMNDVAVELTGWSEEAALGRDISEVFKIVREGSDDLVSTPVERVLREGIIVGLANHTELIARDGSRYSIDDSGAPIRQDGEITGVVLVFHDITEQRNVQKAFVRYEQKLETLLNNLPGMAYRSHISEGYPLEFVNEYAAELTGYSPSEIVDVRKITHADLISEKDAGRVEETLRVSFEDGTPFEITYRMVTADGQEKWVMDKGEPVRGESGGFEYIEGFVTDITEQRHVHERYRALFNSLQDSIIITNDKREIIDCNDAFLEQFGYKFDEVYGTTTSVIYASDSIYTQIGRHVEDFSKDEFFTTEIMCQRKDGSQFHAEMNVGYLHDYLGNRMGNVGVIRDLTAQDIMEQELIHAQKMEALGQMTGGIAHDFNNVIASVSGAVQMLELKLKNESVRKYLDIIKSSVERGKSVTNRMLTFTRSETPKTQPVSLRDFIHEIRDIAQHTIPKNINIRVARYQGPDVVSADPNQLQQVLITLCINAADSMPEGGSIELGIRRAYRQEPEQHGVETDWDYLCIVISDTGAGMDKSILQHIFEPFFTTKERTRGTGLGLSVAYTIIKRHLGWISVDSQKGVGSTFVIGLPAAGPGEQAAEADIASDRLPPAGNGELILVVEDEIALQNLVVEILESHGYRVQVANDSLQALTLFRENPEKFKLILTDLGLPQMSGEELIKHIRQLNEHIPIVAATGYVDEDRISNLLSRGFHALIQKPFSINQLLNTLHTVLSP